MATNKKSTASKSGNIDKQIAEKREQITALQAEIKDLLAKKLNATSGDWQIGSTVYYPAPPQKEVIACKLEIEEDSHGEIVYFVRPICVNKKTGEETLSKRHYSLGTDLSECDELYAEPPKKPKKETAKKTSSKKSAPVEDEEEEAPVKKPTPKKTLGKKKPTLGKKK